MALRKGLLIKAPRRCCRGGDGGITNPAEMEKVISQVKDPPAYFTCMVAQLLLRVGDEGGGSRETY